MKPPINGNYQLTNLVTNGQLNPDYPDGTWKLTHGVSASIVYKGKYGYMRFNAGGTNIFEAPKKINITSGHVYYGSYTEINAKKESNTILVTCTNGSNYLGSGLDASITGEHKEDNLFQAANPGNNSFAVEANSPNGVVEIGKCLLIDLTDTFRPGNEPDLEWCRANIPFFQEKYSVTITDTDITDIVRPFINIPKVLFQLDKDNKMLMENCYYKEISSGSCYYPGDDNPYQNHYGRILNNIKVYRGDKIEDSNKKVRLGWYTRDIRIPSNYTIDIRGFFQPFANSSLNFNIGLSPLHSNEKCSIRRLYDYSSHYYLFSELDNAIKSPENLVNLTGQKIEINYEDGDMYNTLEPEYVNNNIFGWVDRLPYNQYSNAYEKIPPRAILDTNIPIFEQYEDMRNWILNGIGIEKAINYGGIAPIAEDSFAIAEKSLTQLSTNVKHSSQYKIPLEEISSKINKGIDTYRKNNSGVMPIFRTKVQKNILATKWTDAYFYAEMRYYKNGVDMPMSITTVVLDDFKDDYMNDISSFYFLLDTTLEKMQTASISQPVFRLLGFDGVLNPYVYRTILTFKHKIGGRMFNYDSYDCSWGKGGVKEINLFKEYVYNPTFFTSKWNYSDLMREVVIDTNIPLYVYPHANEILDIQKLIPINDLQLNQKDYRIKRETLSSIMNKQTAMEKMYFMNPSRRQILLEPDQTIQETLLWSNIIKHENF